MSSTTDPCTSAAWLFLKSEDFDRAASDLEEATRVMLKHARSGKQGQETARAIGHLIAKARSKVAGLASALSQLEAATEARKGRSQK